jgi:hypothetical protein
MAKKYHLYLNYIIKVEVPDLIHVPRRDIIILKLLHHFGWYTDSYTMGRHIGDNHRSCPNFSAMPHNYWP